MKVLLAVVNCHTRLAYQQCIRDTWLPLVNGADVRFFLGPSTREPQADEVFLDCDDSYQGLPSKVRAIARWALAQGYDYVLKIDDDVVVVPHKLLASNFQSYDFVGHRNDIRPYPVPYGFCYWLSKRSMQLVAVAELPRDNNDEVYVTSVLSKDGITLHHDNRYVIHTGRQEDFAPKVRGLRAPKRDKAWADPVEGPFCWVLYIPWLGYGNLPHEQNIVEFKRLFKEKTQ
jgi:hypothetical protein